MHQGHRKGVVTNAKKLALFVAKCKHQLLICSALTAIIACAASPITGQQYKMSTPIAPGVATPDKLDTSIGTLRMSDGNPDPATVQKIYDNLDQSRALQAYLLAIPIVNQAGMRDSLGQYGPDNQTDVIWENLVDSRIVKLTANDNTVYNFIWLDTHKGPLVLEAPPKVLGGIDDFFTFVDTQRDLPHF